MIPQKFSEWCVDAFGYHPMMKGGQEKLRLQTEKEIKCHMFFGQKWVSEMRDLPAAYDRLEESLEKMLRFGSAMGDREKHLSIQGCRGEDDQILNSVDSCL
jgi:hypothetical protein